MRHFGITFAIRSLFKYYGGPILQEVKRGLKGSNNSDLKMVGELVIFYNQLIMHVFDSDGTTMDV